MKPEKECTMKPLVVTENCTKPFSGCVLVGERKKTSPCIAVSISLVA